MLLVEDVTHGRVLYRAAVDAGDVLVVSYLHSSEQVPVRGTFTVGEDGTLVATETAFAGFGPGLPELRRGDPWRIEDGMIVVSSDGPRLPELLIRVTPTTRHRLRTPTGEELDLSVGSTAGGTIRITTSARPAPGPQAAPGPPGR